MNFIVFGDDFLSECGVPYVLLQAPFLFLFEVLVGSFDARNGNFGS
jgi:hypothetical protein